MLFSSLPVAACRIARDIQPFLLDRLMLGSTDAARRCERYFAEDPAVVARRQELVARKATLENVKAELDTSRL